MLAVIIILAMHLPGAVSDRAPEPLDAARRLRGAVLRGAVDAVLDRDKSSSPPRETRPSAPYLDMDFERRALFEAPKRGVKKETSAKACRGIKRASTCRDKGCKWTKHKKKKKCEAWPFSKKKGKKCKGKGKKSKKCKKKKPPPDNDEPVVVENYAAIYKASAGETLTWSMKKDGGAYPIASQKIVVLEASAGTADAFSVAKELGETLISGVCPVVSPGGEIPFGACSTLVFESKSFT